MLFVPMIYHEATRCRALNVTKSVDWPAQLRVTHCKHMRITSTAASMSQCVFFLVNNNSRANGIILINEGNFNIPIVTGNF